MFKVKVYKNSSFRDKRGYYWTSWEKGTIKNIEFFNEKQSFDDFKISTLQEYCHNWQIFKFIFY